jgi:hypothetical protein
MAKTKLQWYDRLKGWLPTWWFEQTQNQEAVLMGMAAVLEKLELSLDSHYNETFITLAEGAYLDEHGSERNVLRNTGELDHPSYDYRIRNIVNTTNCPAIKAAVDALLQVGTCTIVEDWEGGAFLNYEDFFNRGELVFDAIINTFSIIVDKQVHSPYSFYDREYFGSRENFLGTNESDLALFNLIIESVNRNKALGTLYRLIERVGA